MAPRVSQGKGEHAGTEPCDTLTPGCHLYVHSLVNRCFILSVLVHMTEPPQQRPGKHTDKERYLTEMSLISSAETPLMGRRTKKNVDGFRTKKL